MRGQPGGGGLDVDVCSGGGGEGGDALLLHAAAAVDDGAVYKAVLLQV